jgi:hypothetical protein
MEENRYCRYLYGNLQNHLYDGERRSTLPQNTHARPPVRGPISRQRELVFQALGHISSQVLPPHLFHSALPGVSPGCQVCTRALEDESLAQGEVMSISDTSYEPQESGRQLSTMVALSVPQMIE